MAKFIEIHVKGNPNLVNLDYVEQISAREHNRCVIYQSVVCPDAVEQDYLYPDEPYDMIRKMIGAAQGGIPMEPGRMY